MELFKFFKKKNVSQSELTAQFKAIQARLKELATQAAETKRSALLGEVEDYSTQLNAIRDEQDLLLVAEQRVEEMLRALLAAEIERTHIQLPELVEAYQDQYDQVAGDAGEALGRSLAILNQIGEAWGTSLGQALGEVFEKITSRDSYAEKIAGFLDGYQRGREGAAGVPDLASLKARIVSAEKMVPGSPDAERHIQGRLKALLYKPVPPAPPEPYRRGGFLRGGVETGRISQAADAANKLT